MKRNSRFYSIQTTLVQIIFTLFGTTLLSMPSLLAQSPWTPKTDMPTGRAALSASVVNGKFYVMGGIVNGTPWGGPASPEMEIYDPTTDTWDTTKEHMPAPRIYLEAATVDSLIYIFGGSDNPNNLPAPNVWEYNPATDAYKEVSPMPLGLMHSASGEVNGKIYNFGGFETAIVFPFIASSKVFEYNPDNDLLVAIEKWDKNFPNAFSLNQNYPNPFNPSTTIMYSLPKTCQVRLDILNLLGELVETIVDEKQAIGFYQIQWRPKNLASGMYFYRLNTNEFSDVKKLLFLK